MKNEISKTRKVSLRLDEETYQYHVRQSFKENRSFNGYINNLLKRNMSKPSLFSANKVDAE